MGALARLETGVQGLDELMLGGIPQGRATLVTGRSGTGKTLLGLQIAAHLAHQGIRTLIVAVEEAPSDLRANGDALGLDLSDSLAAGLICFVDVTRLDGATVVSGDYDLAGLTHRLEALARQTRAGALVLDSATALFDPRPPPPELRRQFSDLVTTLRRLALTTIVLADAPEDNGQLTTLGVEDHVCDLTIILRSAAEGSRGRRSIEIAKYNRSAYLKGEHPCILTHQGMAVVPVEPVQGFFRADPTSI
jgi:circadian clock protein KaiC